MDFLPVPKTVVTHNGVFALDRECAIVIDKAIAIDKVEILFALVDRLEQKIGTRPVVSRTACGVGKPILLQREPGTDRDSYTLEILKDRITLSAQDESGIFYALQTLLQIVRQSGRALPCMTIEDSPDFAARGLYFDIARGKIPTFEELCRMADRLASYKMNQFQLYIEYSFAFRKHPDIWNGSDPISAEEIVKLDEYCRKRHIELVPALSTFGHFAMPLKSRRKEHLNEMDISVSATDFSWWERVCGYTLDVSNPESIELVGEMIDELAPLFSTNIFNICCDETWDLGKGKNKNLAEKVGKAALYCEFLNKIAVVVRRNGMVPMLWGDVVLNHPELIGKLPKGAIVLNYDMSANSSPKFKDAKVDFYTCGQLGVQNKWVADIGTSRNTVLKLAKEGFANGASGFLSNEWGDAGHINFHTNSLYGVILGATLSWNTESYNEANIDEFGRTLSHLEFGDASGKTVALIEEMSRKQVVTWHDAAFWIDYFIPQDWREKKTNAPDSIVGIPDVQKVFDAYNELNVLNEELADVAIGASPLDSLAYRELMLGGRGAALLLEISLLCKRAAGLETPENSLTYYDTADKIRLFEAEFGDAWHKRNRPSEYYRIKMALIKMASMLEQFVE